MQPCGVGDDLVWVAEIVRLNTERICVMASKSSGLKINGICPIFSTPMPCSPVRLPPRSTHALRISWPAFITRAVVRVALVVHQDRMNVAIACMKYVGDAELILLGHPVMTRKMSGTLYGAPRRLCAIIRAPGDRPRQTRASGSSTTPSVRRRLWRRALTGFVLLADSHDFCRLGSRPAAKPSSSIISTAPASVGKPK